MRNLQILILTIFLTASGLAQEYIYPNKKLADEGLLEYRRYTLEEACAYEKGGSFEPYLVTDWGEERRLTNEENVYNLKVITIGDSIFCTYSTISSPDLYFINSFRGRVRYH